MIMRLALVNGKEQKTEYYKNTYSCYFIYIKRKMLLKSTYLLLVKNEVYIILHNHSL